MKYTERVLDSAQQPKEPKKPYWVALYFTVALILFFILINKCNNEPKPVAVITDTLTPAINTGKTNATSIAHRVVIVHDTIAKYRTRLVPLYDTLYIHSDSACKSALMHLYKAHNNLDSLQQIESEKKDSVITTLWNVVGLQDLRHSIDSAIIAGHPKELRKAKRKGFWYGLGIGAAAVEAGNVIGKLKN